MEIVSLAIVVGLGLAFTLIRLIGYARTLRNALWLDIGFTLVMPLLFAGSFNGMVLAALSGITLSLVLAFLRMVTPDKVFRRI